MDTSKASTGRRLPSQKYTVNTAAPRDLNLSFWWGGTSTVVIDEIRFE
jgi:hypothetical protein